MKKTLYIALLSFLFIISACDDFLDIDPYDRPATEIALSNVDGLRQALNGTYYRLLAERYYGKMFIAISEYMGDDVKQKDDVSTNDTYGDVYRYSKTTQTVEIDRLWEYCYDVLLRTNNVIMYLPVCEDGTEAEKNDILGQALFIRALTHFDLARAYAQNYNFTPNASHPGIPVLTRPLDVTEKPLRNTAKEVYDQVIADLKEAIYRFDNSDASFDAKYANKWAAIALLSRVYMYMGDAITDENKTGWESCISYASQVIDSSGLVLLSNESYVASWSSLTPSSESIFELARTTASSFSIGAFYTPVGDETYAEAVPTLDLTLLFSATDVRLGLFRVSSQNDNTYCYKYPGGDGQVGLDNVKILRLSEVYLNRAEAYANLDQDKLAQNDLNIICKRADKSVEDIELTGAELLAEIYKERRRELATEGHRIWDITRRHQNLYRLDCDPLFAKQSVEYPNYRFVLPIPLDETTVNKNMEQNENY